MRGETSVATVETVEAPVVENQILGLKFLVLIAEFYLIADC